jgi:hypothetical protein
LMGLIFVLGRKADYIDLAHPVKGKGTYIW